MKRFFTVLWGGLSRWAGSTDPLRVVILGYLSYVLIGWALLCLPISQAEPGIPALDHLFMATSAMSTTGLATISTADSYTFFGELVILLLIQAGGLGYMTIGSFTMLALAGRLSSVHQRVSGAALSLPAGFDLRQFVRLMVLFTLTVEAAGALALYVTVFEPRGVAQPVWQSVFHSVSAFCTAGFGLFNDSFESYRGDGWLNFVLIVLSYLGAIGFIVVTDVWHALTRPGSRVTLTSKIILLSTVCISVVGTVLLFLDEPSVQALPLGERWLVSWFQVMTASTTVGFNTVPIGGLSASSLFLLVIVMMIGASPSGTGGGIKTTTFTALWAVMSAVIRRKPEPVFLGREIPEARVRFAVAGFLFYCLTLSSGIYAVALVENAPLSDLMFECASALGTVGLSRGITGSLTAWGKFIIILLMFFGRVGPVALGMAFFRVPQVPPAENPEEDVAI
jgi:trk system potassium uptake protein TrkH